VTASTQSSLMNERPQTPSVEHKPVLLAEVLEFLKCGPGGTYLDATIGMGGHAQAILERIGPDGLLIGIDRDRESLEMARTRLDSFSNNFRLYHDNFKNLPLILNNLARPPLDGILLDLGVSSHQLLSPERGFSFQGDAPLDMRMDRTHRQTAADLVNNLPEEQLSDLIRRFGEERYARRIAAAIARVRSQGDITRCSQLAEIVKRAIRARGPQRIHPATRTFQALRIAVNSELEGLEALLVESVGFLKPGGRMVAISFHSLEDRIVKQAFRRLAGQCVCDRPAELCTCPRQVQATLVTPRPVSAGPIEVESNPRARSAKLRVIERIQVSD